MVKDRVGRGGATCTGQCQDTRPGPSKEGVLPELSDQLRAVWKWTQDSVLMRHPNPGAGDCLYHAMAQALATTGDPTTQGRLRKDTVEYMRHHTEEVLHAWDYETPEPISSPCHSFPAYLEAAAQPGAWAGDVELVALGKMFPSHPILVLSPGGTPMIFGDRALPLPRMEDRITLWLQGGHFELLSSPVPEWIWSALWEDSCPLAKLAPPEWI